PRCVLRKNIPFNAISRCVRDKKACFNCLRRYVWHKNNSTIPFPANNGVGAVVFMWYAAHNWVCALRSGGLLLRIVLMQMQMLYLQLRMEQNGFVGEGCFLVPDVITYAGVMLVVGFSFFPIFTA
ncbi:MAG TPA: hypothetical protein VHO90_03020, partial [Bacteroidales bacterium]|nr:hypothetical protein [Bacteroidales bacterium]